MPEPSQSGPVRVRWEDRRGSEMCNVVGEKTEDGWHFFEKSLGETRWYECVPTERLIVAAERALEVSNNPDSQGEPPLPTVGNNPDAIALTPQPAEVVSAPALSGAYHSCFISYSSEDREFVKQLVDDLTKAAVECWFAPNALRGGDRLYDQIRRAIARHDKLLLVLSRHSMRSEWVRSEIIEARRRETKEQSRFLFPIALVSFTDIKSWQCFDADTGEDAARSIREYFILDFSSWRDRAAYSTSLSRLLSDLTTDKRSQ